MQFRKTMAFYLDHASRNGLLNNSMRTDLGLMVKNKDNPIKVIVILFFVWSNLTQMPLLCVNNNILRELHWNTHKYFEDEVFSIML